MLNSKPVITVCEVGLAYPRHASLFRLSREKFWAINNVSFKVHQGEIIGLIGRNGAGKSTLLKLLAGITSPDSGKITFRPDMRTTLLSIQAGFDPHLSGRENAMLSGMLLGMRRREILQKIDDITELAALGTFIDEPLRTYSSGMRARLGFATAYYTDTDIMLLDEILSVGDAKFSVTARTLMEERINSNKTAILVSHSEKTVKELCPRLIWLENGLIREDGKTDEVWGNYRKALGLAQREMNQAIDEIKTEPHNDTN